MAYALITGAAKGIGKAIAAELALRNYELLLIDLDNNALNTTAGDLAAEYHVNVHTLHQDLSHPDALRNVISWSSQWHDQLTVVVNNAGYGLNGAFEQLPLEDQFNIIDVNVKAQVGLSYAFIPVLRKFPKAYLLNLASTTAYQTVPYLNIYAATKAFALSFTRGLRHELRHSNISVSALSPGSTDTDFVNRARMNDATKKLADRFNMTPQSVAKIAVNGLFKGKAEIVPGFTNKLNAFLPKFFPKAFVERIAGNIYEQKEKARAPEVALTT
ncbi:MAG TPA: SDR family NAD(P)-dependent oxidoreductase [Chitinophaga sp.]|uniref:SDR family NAD(P)-dependent oxidoreductase n=1 Tax=Chitinophaga sp. TaxID=1869181 RepID=UPI002BD504E6|nr:SDR family NAD(P)-dependent oxidoreductase [Chitinophaga sp.]HVI47660.1 SDR family NAD(P)-dependent oxidoreductase [Chitinophaga sp.]